MGRRRGYRNILFLFFISVFFLQFFCFASDTPSVLKLDNFWEQTLRVGDLKGEWLSDEDSHNGGDSKAVLTLCKGEDGQENAVRLDYELGQKYQYRYSIMRLKFSEPIDISSYQFLSFRLKGNGHKLKIHLVTGEIKDYNYHTYLIDSTSSRWKEYIIPLASFQQEDWGEKKPLDLKNIVMLQFQTGSVQEGEKGFFTLEKVELHSDSEKWKNYLPKTLLLSDYARTGVKVDLLNGEWKAESDSVMGGNSEAEISVSRGGKALKLDYALRKDCDNRYAVAKLAFLNPVDLSKYNTISFSIRGSGSKVKIYLGSEGVTDYDYHGYEIGAASESWKEYKIPFYVFKQEGWGNYVPLDLNRLKLVQFKTISRVCDEKGWFEIESVRLTREDDNLIRTFGGFKNYDVVRKDKQDNGCFLGAFSESYSRNIGDIHLFESKIGKKLAQIMWYQDWSSSFPSKECNLLTQEGYLPHITWEPWISGDTNSIKLDNILSGQWDEYIAKWADDSVEFGKPYFLRWGHEFNLKFYPWSILLNDKSPEKYARAFRYVRDIFIKRGATNAIWIWCVNHVSFPNDKENDVIRAYPGDDYVDWIAIDAYNFGFQQGYNLGWSTFDDLFSSMYITLVKKIADKPIMVGEFATTPMGGSKSTWIKDTGISLAEKYPAIKSVVWFNVNKETDWRVDGNPEIAKAFYETVSNDYFLSSAQGLLNVDKKVPGERNLYLDSLKLLNPYWNKPILSASKFSGILTVDGDLSDWPSGVSTIQMNKENFSRSSSSRSSNHFKASIKIMADSAALYIGCELEDDFPVLNPFTNGEIYKGDSLEMTLCKNPKADLGRLSFTGEDYHIILGTGDEKLDLLPSIWNVSKGELGDGEVNVKRTKNGYIMEARLLFSNLGDFIYKKGERFGFDLIINDAGASGERDRQAFWTGNSEFYRNPSVWGLVEFKEE
jgi:beta-mannanase